MSTCKILFIKFLIFSFEKEIILTFGQAITIIFRPFAFCGIFKIFFFVGYGILNILVYTVSVSGITV